MSSKPKHAKTGFGNWSTAPWWRKPWDSKWLEIKLVDIVLREQIRLAKQDVIPLDFDRTKPARGETGGAWVSRFLS